MNRYIEKKYTNVSNFSDELPTRRAVRICDRSGTFSLPSYNRQFVNATPTDILYSHILARL